MLNLHDLLDHLMQKQADWLQLQPGFPPTLLLGKLPHPLPYPSAKSLAIERLVEGLVDVHQRDALERGFPTEGYIERNAGERFRFKAQRLPSGMSIAFSIHGKKKATPAAAFESDVQPLIEEPTAPEPAPAEQASSPSVELLEETLRQALKRGASDIVLSCGHPAAARVSGGFEDIGDHVFSDRDIKEGLAPMMSEIRWGHLEETGNADLAYELLGPRGERQSRFRVNVFKQMSGLAAAFRPILDEVPNFSMLNLPKAMTSIVDFAHGLVLVTGPTGSGKSTTLASLIDHINEARSCHIITLEDPIEYLFRRKAAIVHQREVGTHVESFSSGLRAALRENPDVILVGEMRDRETIASALTAAETGHLVLSTLHTGTAAQAIDRIIDVFPDHQQQQIRTQIADVLKGIVTQRLLPTTDGNHRVPAIEIVRVNAAVSNLIREAKTHMIASQLQRGLGEGMIPFDHSVAHLIRTGWVSRETGFRVCQDRRTLETLLGT
jgi:twitching motility protein PilT